MSLLPLHRQDDSIQQGLPGPEDAVMGKSTASPQAILLRLHFNRSHADPMANSNASYRQSYHRVHLGRGARPLKIL